MASHLRNTCKRLRIVAIDRPPSTGMDQPEVRIFKFFLLFFLYSMQCLQLHMTTNYTHLFIGN